MRFLKSTFMLDCQDDGGEREREKVLRWGFFLCMLILLYFGNVADNQMKH